MGGIDFHGAHPQFNLLEGNVATKISQDSIWGSSSHTTCFRNWVVGTNHICTTTDHSRVKVVCNSSSYYGFQAARAMDYSYLATRNNFVGNVVGSPQMQSLVSFYYDVPGFVLNQVSFLEYPSGRGYDNYAYLWTLGYGETSDDGSGTGCSSGVPPPCHKNGTSETDLFHGNFDNINGSITWTAGISHALPDSLYLTSKPYWWGSLVYPATGPDVTGSPSVGGHSFGNPAQKCYFDVMKGVDGGAGSPLAFDPIKCYYYEAQGSVNEASSKFTFSCTSLVMILAIAMMMF